MFNASRNIYVDVYPINMYFEMIFNSLGNCHQFLVSLNSFRFAWFGLRSYFAVFYVYAFILDGGEGLLENQPCRPSESKQMPQKLVNPHFGMP